ncbi:MAG: hypothetical protein VKJ09_03045 [Leptolyngbya sp.]|nr:hypothetical protein [Leptolyngbya sp.]
MGMGLWAVLGGGAIAVPGNSVSNVEAWIQSHPTLRPGPNERLVVNRADTPARRFRFRATVIPVTGLSPDLVLGRTIRTEETTLVDMVDGITTNRMEEALRAIYDATIYNDYRRAPVVYRYINRNTPTYANGIVRQGELRQGERFAYWIERVGNPDGFDTIGTLTVFLLEDLPALQADLEATYGPL